MVYTGKITCASTVAHTPDAIRSCAVFANWYKRVNSAGFTVTSVHVADAFQWGDVAEPRMLMLRVDAHHEWQKLDPNVFLRGDTVCAVATLLCNGRRYGVLTLQPRLAGANSKVMDWPAGMVESTDIAVNSAALRELLEETDTKDLVKWTQYADLSAATTNNVEPLGVSEGGTDEGVTYYWFEASVGPDVLSALQGKIAGVHGENERTTVTIVPWRAIPRVLGQNGRPSLKALSGWLMLTYYLAYRQ